MRNRKSQRGAALLAVLWLSAILTAIAFSVATTVRGETERTSTLVGGCAGVLRRDRSAGASAGVHRMGARPPKSRQHAALFRARNGPAEFQLSGCGRHCRNHPGVVEVRHQRHPAARAYFGCWSISGPNRGAPRRSLRPLSTGGSRFRLTHCPCSISSIFRAIRLSGRGTRLWKRRKSYSL